MKGALAGIVLSVLGLVGCSDASTPEPTSMLPRLGTPVTIAIGDDDRTLTYDELIDVVCLEKRVYPHKFSKGTRAPVSCWETKHAPKKIRELVEIYNKNQCDAGLSC